MLVFRHSPLGENRPAGPERGRTPRGNYFRVALAGRYASVSLGNRGLTPSG